MTSADRRLMRATQPDWERSRNIIRSAQVRDRSSERRVPARPLHPDDGECGPQLRLPLLAAWDQRPSLGAESVELVERPVRFGVQLPPCEPRVVGPVAQGSEDPTLILALGGHDAKEA
jgi:hypothetical protein